MTKPSDIRPKKQPTPVQAAQAEAQGDKPGLIKKPFVRKPHLTHRPFVSNDLAALRAMLDKQKGRA